TTPEFLTLRDQSPEFGLFLPLLLHEPLVQQPIVFSFESLQRVLDREDLVRSLARLFGSARAILLQNVQAPIQHAHDHRGGVIALSLELLGGLQPLRRAWMAGYEDQIPRIDAGGVPPQVALAFHRIAVLVHAEERHIQTIARVGEIVGVPAEEGNLLFRREYQPYIGVLLVTVEPVLAAAVQRNHV